MFVSMNATFIFCQQLSIGVFSNSKINAVNIGYGSGKYEVRSDSALICKIESGSSVKIKISEGKLQLSKNDVSLGRFNRIIINEIEKDSYLTFTPSTASGTVKTRKYMNNFVIAPTKNATIKIINEVSMDNYLAGVIESEGGGGKHIEYYKVQAVLSRTYALDHLKKHQKDSFQLCDQTHCQAYLNMMRFTPSIKNAVEETKGIVMISQQFKLADGFFFANCGGQTSESDFVWNVPVSYCKSVRDTFCIYSKQATWTKKISKSEWSNYLTNEFGYPIHDSIWGPLIYHFNQPQRTAFYISPHLGIPLRDLREKFKLKSTWFSTYLKDGELILEGKGFGHGVGLCQEGAMRMAQYGYTYEQILHFYFTGIYLFNYNDWLFLNQKESVIELL